MNHHRLETWDVLTNSIWKHVRTGELRKVSGIDELRGVIQIKNIAGDEKSLTAGQLTNLFVETEDAADAAAFVDAESMFFGTLTDGPGDVISIGRLSMDLNPVEPLPDRRRFSNGSTRAAEKVN